VTVRRGVRLPLEQLAPYLLDLSDPPAPVDFEMVYGNVRQVEMEIGFGKGLFLLNSALSRPGVNFFGVEIERKYQLFTATRMAKRGLTNVRLACGDAREILRDHISTDSMKALHVYFPDPWWKTRHRKRRLWTSEFAAECARVIRPGGTLHTATDVEEYSRIIAGHLAKQPQLRELPTPGEKNPEHDLDFLTNFERKSRQAGRAIYRSLHQKTG
jgi:tRNA (guanine-N7-)-methyltransferase